MIMDSVKHGKPGKVRERIQGQRKPQGNQGKIKEKIREICISPTYNFFYCFLMLMIWTLLCDGGGIITTLLCDSVVTVDGWVQTFFANHNFSLRDDA